MGLSEIRESPESPNLMFMDDLHFRSESIFKLPCRGYPISATPIWCFSSCWVCGSKGQALSVSKTAGSFFEDPKYDPSICAVYPCLKILAYLNSYPNFLVVRVPLFVLGMPCVLAKTCKHHTKPVPKRNV